MFTDQYVLPMYLFNTRSNNFFFKGAHYRKGTTDVQQELNVKTVIIHGNFTTKNLRNDIALIQLDRPVQISDKVSTVCLPAKAPDLNANCYITGTLYSF